MDTMTVVSIILRILWYLIFGYGVFVCVSAYRASKKRAWLLIALFCLSPFIIFALNKTKNAMRAPIRTRQPIRAHKAYIAQAMIVRHIIYKLPILQICLVVGLSILAEEEIKRNKPRCICDTAS